MNILNCCRRLSFTTNMVQLKPRWATVYKITPAESELTVPIGKPISNCQIYILDENQNSVPIGVSGELFIGGKGVAKGYLNNAELTNKSFIQNNFNPESSNKLYRTGDL